MSTSYKKETREPSREPERKESRMVNCWSTTLPLCNPDQHEVHHGLSSGIWTCWSRGVKKLPYEWWDEC